jgi:hypothetical protein
MRIATALSFSLLLACAPIASASAQSVSIDLKLGPARTVAAYSSEQFGDWHTSYKQWTPKTMYYVNGQYYDHTTKGARAVAVYQKGGKYFLPPQDNAWVGKDKRYNYKNKPTDEDYRHR